MGAKRKKAKGEEGKNKRKGKRKAEERLYKRRKGRNVKLKKTRFQPTSPRLPFASTRGKKTKFFTKFAARFLFFLPTAFYLLGVLRHLHTAHVGAVFFMLCCAVRRCGAFAQQGLVSAETLLCVTCSSRAFLFTLFYYYLVLPILYV